MASRTSIGFEQHRELLDAWVSTRERIARLEAEASSLLNDRLALLQADIAEQPFHRDAIRRSMIAEHSAAARMSKGTVERAFGDAEAIHADFPAVLGALRAGKISAAHVREIAMAASPVLEAVNNKRVDAVALSIYAEAVLAVAENDTPARTRAQARQIASVVAEETLRERHARAASERQVSVRSLGDGLALLTAVLPEEIATAIIDRLNQMSRQIMRSRADREPVLDPERIDGGPDPIHPEDILDEDILYDGFLHDGFSNDRFSNDGFLHEDTAYEGFPHDRTVREDAACDDRVTNRTTCSPEAIFGENDTFTTDPLVDRASTCIEHIPDDERSIDEVRADLFADLLLVSDPSAAHGTGLDSITAHIQVTIAAKTLIGSDDRLAELDGHGPLHPDIVRDLAGRNGGWTRLFQDPTGMIVESDTYSPTEGMRRYLRARDQHCRFPGCRMPVRRCEIDHNHDYAKGGRTCLGNLAHFCHGHHVLKHPDIHDDFRWSAQAQTDGSIAWYSPLGRVYLDQPPRRVMFVDSPFSQSLV